MGMLDCPNNVKINQLFGVTHGLGMSVITFDWGQIIAFKLSTPTPWWSAANTGFSIIFFYWFLLPILYRLPTLGVPQVLITQEALYLSQIINADGSFNLEAYQAYSPVFLPLSFAMCYGLSFASIAALLTHTLLYNSKKSGLMLAVPSESSLTSMLASCLFTSRFLIGGILHILGHITFGVIVIEVWDTQLPIWAFVLSLTIVGAIAPLIQWTCHKKFKLTFLKYVNFPVIFGVATYMPPATPFNYTSWVLVCFLFNYVIRRRHIFWWSKYNYLVSIGLDAGYSLGIIVIVFALQYPKNGAIGLNTIQQWWGNTVYTKTADFRGVPYKEIPDGGKFGPSSW
ncbi:OPT oligopeptide transporter protein-domain-containing protein [Lactifluus volemus]|nr:OPT oligopeptide transporter protein-domain-containing protein [Lactifluus volemus]